MSFDEVVNLLKIEYELAKQQKWIKNPIAYALYEVWKKADSYKNRKE